MIFSVGLTMYAAFQVLGDLNPRIRVMGVLLRSIWLTIDGFHWFQFGSGSLSVPFVCLIVLPRNKPGERFQG